MLSLLNCKQISIETTNIFQVRALLFHFGGYRCCISPPVEFFLQSTVIYPGDSVWTLINNLRYFYNSPTPLSDFLNSALFLMSNALNQTFTQKLGHVPLHWDISSSSIMSHSHSWLQGHLGQVHGHRGLSCPRSKWLTSRVTMTKYHYLSGLDNRNLLSRNSGGLKSKVKVLVGSVSSGVPRGKICFKPITQLLIASDTLWFMDQSILCLSYNFSLHLCVSLCPNSLFNKDIGHIDCNPPS